MKLRQPDRLIRVVGGALTLIPVVGDVAHEVIDDAADAVDEVPL